MVAMETLQRRLAAKCDCETQLDGHRSHARAQDASLGTITLVKHPNAYKLEYFIYFNADHDKIIWLPQCEKNYGKHLKILRIKMQLITSHDAC
jgi:hypothetical protein